MANDGQAHAAAYQRNPAVLSASLGSEAVALLDASRETYYGLEGPATRIWELLETPMTVDQICATLVAEYDVEPSVCERDTREHIAEMSARGLLVEQAPS
jgi:hypothetical protein